MTNYSTNPQPQAAEEMYGKAGEFDFLAGSWKISHRKLKASGGNEWETFKGEATCWTVLGGCGSIEELRLSPTEVIGLGIRLLDIKQRVWLDFWVSGGNGVLAPPGMPGVFKNGVGTFEVDDLDGDQPIKVRGVWDRITPTSCRWYQTVSRDGGQVWEDNWFMDWVRV